MEHPTGDAGAFLLQSARNGLRFPRTVTDACAEWLLAAWRRTLSRFAGRAVRVDGGPSRTEEATELWLDDVRALVDDHPGPHAFLALRTWAQHLTPRRAVLLDRQRRGWLVFEDTVPQVVRGRLLDLALDGRAEPSVTTLEAIGAVRRFVAVRGHDWGQEIGVAFVSEHQHAALRRARLVA